MLVRLPNVPLEKRIALIAKVVEQGRRELEIAQWSPCAMTDTASRGLNRSGVRLRGPGGQWIALASNSSTGTGSPGARDKRASAVRRGPPRTSASVT